MSENSKDSKSKKLSRRQFLGTAGSAIAATTLSGSILSGAVCASKHKESTGAQSPDAQGSVEVTLKINGKPQTLRIQPRVTLLDTLRERLSLTGTKRICDRGNCGGCTVLLDGKPIYACMMLAVDAQNKEITTIEGLATPQNLTELQKQFVEKDALMCGFCTPGFVMACHAALKANPNATREEIKQACRGNICRCGTFNRVFEAAYAIAKPKT